MFGWKTNTGRMVIIKQSMMYLTMLLAVDSAKKTQNVKTLAMAIQPKSSHGNVIKNAVARYNAEVNLCPLLRIYLDVLASSVRVIEMLDASK